MSALCDTPLGMKDGTIQDSQMTASSEWDANHGPSNARLDRPRVGDKRGAWNARNNDANPWIQVDLGVATSVSGIVIQGGFDQWVTDYQVQYGNDTTVPQYIKDINNNETVRPNVRDSIILFLSVKQ